MNYFIVVRSPSLNFNAFRWILFYGFWPFDAPIEFFQPFRTLSRVQQTVREESKVQDLNHKLYVNCEADLHKNFVLKWKKMIK